MIKRPTSMTVIGWLLIVGGVWGLIASALLELSPIAAQAAARSVVPLPIREIYGVIDGLVVAACGIGFLKGLWWSRLVYLAWALLRIAFGLFFTPIWVTAIVLVIYFIVLSILCRRSANLWFEASAY